LARRRISAACERRRFLWAASLAVEMLEELLVAGEAYVLVRLESGS
jgi:hypothetical protein